MATSRYTGNSPEEIGKRLPLDTSARRPHCGTDNSCSIRRTSKGISWHCFRCHEGGFIPVLPTLAEIRARNACTALVQENPGRDISDLTSELPAHATAFLASRGCPPVPWALWSPGLARLCFRLQWKEPEGWLTRDTSVPRPKPKYIMYSKCRAATPLFRDGNLISISEVTDGHIVIVEDFLSAYKVSTVPGVIGMALIGTHAIDTHLARIMLVADRAGKHDVTLWLDPDRAGIQGAKTVSKTLKLCGLDARLVTHGSKDPKYYSTETVKEVLCFM